MRIRISHLVNTLTRQALYERVVGYVDKEGDFAALERRARTEYGVDHLYRFDLGENADGCSPKVLDFVRGLSPAELTHILSAYPDTAASLKAELSRLHRVPERWIALGTGVESFISILCHTFYEWGDRVVLPTPNFFVIEEYVLRSGALPIYLPSSPDDGFAWSPELTERLIHQIQCVPVKMVWLTTPNNPTGQAIPLEEIERIVQAAEESFTMVVVDEAYGEFTDDLAEHESAARMLERFENLIVLRSFSKAYGLAGMRIGYAMISSSTVHDAVARQMEYFPVTRLSIDLARIAAEDQEYLAITRRVTRERLHSLQLLLANISGCECVPSQSNVFLCRVTGLKTSEMQDRLLRRGIVTSSADVEGLSGQGWVRVTCRAPEENARLISAIRAVVEAG